LWEALDEVERWAGMLTRLAEVSSELEVFCDPLWEALYEVERWAGMLTWLARGLVKGELACGFS
jgi:hypothetical protein